MHRGHHRETLIMHSLPVFCANNEHSMESIKLTLGLYTATQLIKTCKRSLTRV